MAVTAACFKWADVLETQFDKSWVELDTVLSQLEDDEDYGLIHVQTRRSAASLASCFSQFAHKATTIFQNNAKLEAELIHLREELAETVAVRERAQREKQHVTVLLQAALLAAQNGGAMEEDVNGKDDPEADIPVSADPSEDVVISNGASINGDVLERQPSDGLVEQQCVLRLLHENKKLRAELLELESEMIGARLDNVYLDKELAGRIQQIQLLLASNTPADRKEKMWSQIESEMCLQRSKTIAQMCKTKQEVKSRMREESSHVARLPPPDTTDAGPQSLEETEGENRRGKQAMILKNPADDLGMAIIGGQEHNLPIIISEIFPGTAVARSNRINAGDIILSVNGEDFSKIQHTEAVNFLSSLRGQIILELKSSETVSEDDPSNLDYRFYKIFDPAITKEGVDAVSVSAYSSRRGSNASHPGKAVASPRVGLETLETMNNGSNRSQETLEQLQSLEQELQSSPQTPHEAPSSPSISTEIPSVHSSPRRVHQL